jgi:hypothetical protein
MSWQLSAGPVCGQCRTPGTTTAMSRRVLGPRSSRQAPTRPLPAPGLGPPQHPSATSGVHQYSSATTWQSRFTQSLIICLQHVRALDAWKYWHSLLPILGEHACCTLGLQKAHGVGVVLRAGSTTSDANADAVAAPDVPTATPKNASAPAPAAGTKGTIICDCPISMFSCLLEDARLLFLTAQSRMPLCLYPDLQPRLVPLQCRRQHAPTPPGPVL